MRYHDLARELKLLKRCNEFHKKLIFSHKIQGVKASEELKELKEDVENQINIIEGEESGK